IDGADVTDRHPSERSIAMVFQDYGLYTTMSVAENMAYGLKHSTSMTAAERRTKVEEMAEMFGIEELLDRDVGDLSGGQKQRVSLGRAMVREPDVFLLDEPLASLDAKLRSEMRTDLQQLQAEMDITTVYVTHNQKEAMTMADRIAVLDDGVLQQADAPETVYSNPTNRFVADFLGNPPMNQLDAVVERGAKSGTYAIRCFDEDAAITVARVSEPPAGLSPGDEVVFGVRPEALSVESDATDATDATDARGFDGTVAVTEYQGNDNFIHCRVAETELTAVVPPTVQPAAGETVGLSVAPGDVYLFDPSTGAALLTAGETPSETPPRP
ncbi:MAG: ABC transporter ATP-binding protein, partial [Halolamina sp.]